MQHIAASCGACLAGVASHTMMCCVEFVRNMHKQTTAFRERYAINHGVHAHQNCLLLQMVCSFAFVVFTAHPLCMVLFNLNQPGTSPDSIAWAG